MRLLNQRYMAAATSFQSLHHLINRLQRRGRAAVATGADRAVSADRRRRCRWRPPQQHEPAVLTRRLRDCVALLPAHTGALRAPFDDPAARLEFDTGAALMLRFTDELADFTAVESLAAQRQPARQCGARALPPRQRPAGRGGGGAAHVPDHDRAERVLAGQRLGLWRQRDAAGDDLRRAAGRLAQPASPRRRARVWATPRAWRRASWWCSYCCRAATASPCWSAPRAGLLLIGPYLAHARRRWPGVGAGYTLGFRLHPRAEEPDGLRPDALPQ